MFEPPSIGYVCVYAYVCIALYICLYVCLCQKIYTYSISPRHIGDILIYRICTHLQYQVELHRNKPRTKVSSSMWNLIQVGMTLESDKLTTNLHTQANTNIY
jgi:hypothetical protein